MKSFVAGAMLSVVILLGAFGLRYTASAVYADDGSSVEITAYQSETNEDETDEQSDDESEEGQVLGERRDERTDKFSLCVEIAIFLVFATGLVAAGKGGYEN